MILNFNWSLEFFFRVLGVLRARRLPSTYVMQCVTWVVWKRGLSKRNHDGLGLGQNFVSGVWFWGGVLGFIWRSLFYRPGPTGPIYRPDRSGSIGSIDPDLKGR